MYQRQIIELEKEINNNYSNIAGLVVLKDGRNIYENYFNGCNADSSVHVYSVTKSIVSLLIGIAIDKGLIKSIDQKVIDFFPSHKFKKKQEIIREITIKDLLTMSVPFKFGFEPLTYMRYFMSDDWVNFTLDLFGGNGKIGDFKYTPLVGPDILMGILTKVTKESAFDFAVDNLFSPLGITVEKSIFFKSAREQTAFNKSTNMSGWAMDKTGVNSGGWGLSLSTLDMAKIGQLYLNNGLCNGKQIVSADWIEVSTKKHNKGMGENLSYGYLWWIIDEQKRICAAMGDGGNIIYFNSKRKIVVSISSLFAKGAKDRIRFIREHIEPIFEN